jgi:hypothetical protein
MFDIDTAAFAYGFLAIAAVTFVVAVAAIVVVLRDLRNASATPVLVTVAGPSERAFTRAA